MRDAGILSKMGLVCEQNLRVGSLRYPGGEKADGLNWNYAPKPVLARGSYSDWPASDSTYYDLQSTSFVGPLLDFDQFMSLAQTTGSEPFVVISYDSANRPAYPGGFVTSLAELKVVPETPSPLCSSKKMQCESAVRCRKPYEHHSQALEKLAPWVATQ